MKTDKQIVICVLLACAGLIFTFASDLLGASSVVTVNPDAGAVKEAKIDNVSIGIGGRGGFQAFDVKEKRKILFAGGSVKADNGKTVFSCLSEDLKLTAEFEAKVRYILVKGRIENVRKKDRAIILDYWIKPSGSDAIFCEELNTSRKIGDKQVEYEGNVFPLAAMCTKSGAIAMAIPPSEPRIFGMAGGQKGLCTRFYLGISPETKKFPNSASFAFIIYPSDPAWQFRSALNKYYSFYPEFYKRKFEQGGLAMLAMKDAVPPNVTQYSFNRSGMSKYSLDQEVPRDEKYGILTMPSNIVGMREITKLQETPSDYNDAMLIYKAFCKDGNNPLLCETIDTSACGTAGGKLNVVIRDTFWGGSSITFKTNPNPDLFSDTKKACVGSDNLALMLKRLTEYPQMDGIFLDSLGRVFPSILNFRRDHFLYARYPLTFDSKGQLALHNSISHYEFIETLRAELDKQKKYIWANGVYAFNTGGPEPEHYLAKAKIGGFFMASMLDVACSEIGIRATDERCGDARVFMGQKPYAILNYEWEDAAKVDELVNRSLCYAIFATSKDNPFTKAKYYDNPNGYKKDKELLDWFVPNARILHKAGWEPLTYAAVNDEKVLLERYGSGDTVYFALMSETDDPQNCTLTIDLKSLGFNAGDFPKGFSIEEIARKTPLKCTAPNNIELQLKPFKTCIIAVNKTGQVK